MKIIKKAIYPTFPLHLEGDDDFFDPYRRDDEEEERHPSISEEDHFGILGFLHNSKAYVLLEDKSVHPCIASADDFDIDTHIPPLPKILSWMLPLIRKKSVATIYYDPERGVDSLEMCMACEIASDVLDQHDDLAMKSDEFQKSYIFFGKDYKSLTILYNMGMPELSKSGAAKVQRIARIAKEGKPETRTLAINKMREVFTLPGEDAVVAEWQFDDANTDKGPILLYTPNDQVDPLAASVGALGVDF
jgi:hypothetical protein